MGRNYTEADLYRLCDRIRSLAPDAAIRTTLITGFPGEDDTCCRQLLGFMEKIRFDHLGVFVYSDSEDLPSHRLSGHVPKRVAEARYDLLMSKQREISLENNKNRIHKRYTVLVDGMTSESVFSGRTYFQAPEVDGLTYVSFSESLTPGCFVETEITDALEYDLVGDPLWAT
jgi:ribosomal protein S12 methylthiotransferase